MIAARKLKEKINSRTPTLGMLATDHVWPRLVEISKSCGLDYLVVDCEHGPHSDQLVADICQVGRILEFPILVRVVDSEIRTVRRATDLGPCGLVIPCMETVDQLERVKETIYLPPRGKRRPGGLGNYHVSDYRYETWKTELEDDFIVIPQIESKIGLVNCQEIAAHEIVTAIGVGPYDLSMEFGCACLAETEEFQEALQVIRKSGEDVEKNMWVVGDGPTLAKAGYSFICMATPELILSNALKEKLAQIQNIESDNTESKPMNTNPYSG